MEFDLRALEINARSRAPPDSQSTFRVESAAKLLPKLASEHELEVYLITFRKIASLNNWPKEHWSAILQTQLKGKALRVFAELPDSVIQDFDQLQVALLAAKMQFFFKQKTAYEIRLRLVGSEMCIRDRGKSSSQRLGV